MVLRYKSIKSVKIKINWWTKRVCHRFLPIDRYNRYQSNQIYRFLSIYWLTNRYRFLSIDYSGNKSLKDWSLGKQLILFPSNLNVFHSSASGNIEILGKQNLLIPSGAVFNATYLSSILGLFRTSYRVNESWLKVVSCPIWV